MCLQTSPAVQYSVRPALLRPLWPCRTWFCGVGGAFVAICGVWGVPAARDTFLGWLINLTDLGFRAWPCPGAQSIWLQGYVPATYVRGIIFREWGGTWKLCALVALLCGIWLTIDLRPINNRTLYLNHTTCSDIYWKFAALKRYIHPLSNAPKFM